MIQAFFNRLKRKVQRSYALSHLKICNELKAQPQLQHATELTNALRLHMIKPKCDLLLTNVFKAYWNVQQANQYRLTSQGNSLLEMTNSAQHLIGLLDADFALTKDDIFVTPKEILLGTYLTQHAGIFTNPYQAVLLFKQTAIDFAQALQFYLDRHPDYAQYMLRLMSGYTVSINNVLDDLVELQCDLLSP